MRNILISDDIEQFTRHERTFLLREEFHLITANSGREVFEFARKCALDTIFMDFLLSDMGGDECCMILKRDERYSRIPVIMIVNSGRTSDIERSKMAGCDAVITKPIHLSTFLDTAREYLQIKKRLPIRYPFRVPVYYGTSPQQLLKSDTVNLSKGGLFIETDRPFAFNTMLTVELFLPHTATIISCSARVAWTNQPEHLQNLGLPAGMGVLFFDLDPEDLELIQGLIEQWNSGPMQNDGGPDAAQVRSAETSATILIVDSNSGNRKRIRSILQREQYGILEATDLQEALALAATEHPALVIAAASLQGEGGNDLRAKLNQNHQGDDIPVLFISGWAFSVGSSRALESGTKDYISRPFRERDLLAKVWNALTIRHLSESLTKTCRQILTKEREHEDNMKAAAFIQQSLLPNSMPRIASFDFAWRFMPCERVGGDLFNVFKMDETHVGGYILDVSGHGVPAAMMATSVAQALNPFNSQFLKTLINSPPYYKLVTPSKVLTELNREYPIERFERHFTICYLILDVQSGELCYSNAAHPFPLLIKADGRVEKLSAGGTIIGIGDGLTYEEETVKMECGDRVFLFTDGIVEHADKGGDLYGEERLIRELLATTGETLQMACAAVINSLMIFSDKQMPGDDIALVGIERRKTG